MKKKLLALLIAMQLVIQLAGCGDAGRQPGRQQSQTNNEETTSNTQKDNQESVVSSANGQNTDAQELRYQDDYYESIKGYWIKFSLRQRMRIGIGLGN